VGAFPRKEGMERKDLLLKNAAIFKEQGAALDKFAKKNCQSRGGWKPCEHKRIFGHDKRPKYPKRELFSLDET